MANYSPVINTRGLIFADHRGILLRSSYYVYQMYKPCAGGFSVSSEIVSPKLESSNALALDVATVQVDANKIYLFVVNRALEELSCQVNIPDFNVKASSGTILTAGNLRSYNNFEHPDLIVPRAFEANFSGENFNVRFPKHSLSVLILEK
jgi:alpha-N-arabinofuranosidase